MKRVITAAMSVMIALLLTVSTSAKVVVVAGDMVYEAIESGVSWKLDSYTGSAESLTLDDQYSDMPVQQIGDYAFLNNTTLKNINTGSVITAVGSYAFSGCGALESVTLPDTLLEIGTAAFSYTSALCDINLVDTAVNVIPPYCFAGSGVTEIKLPDGCSKVSSCAFQNCHGLRRITIPNSVEMIEEYAFDGSENIVVRANHDAYAITYAQEQGLPYEYADIITVSYLLGDADGDGDITIIDATKIQRVLAELVTDDDGMIARRGHVMLELDQEGADPALDITDATRIQRWLAEFEVPVNIGETITETIYLY